MTRFQQALLVCGFLLVATFDVLLLRQLGELREENATLRKKVAPSLDQQFALYEHGLEGVDLSPLLGELRRSEERFAALDPGTGGYRLWFYFPDRNCRRSLHREVALLREHRSALLQAGIEVAMVFGDLAETDFLTLGRQLGISELAVLDRQGVVRRHLGARPSTLVLGLDPRDRVLFAQVARSTGNEGARPLYRKLELVASLRPRPEAPSGRGDDG